MNFNFTVSAMRNTLFSILMLTVTGERDLHYPQLWKMHEFEPPRLLNVNRKIKSLPSFGIHPYRVSEHFLVSDITSGVYPVLHSKRSACGISGSGSGTFLVSQEDEQYPTRDCYGAVPPDILMGLWNWYVKCSGRYHMQRTPVCNVQK